MPLTSYRQRVERLASERDGEPVYNGSTEHASIIAEKMFAHSCDNVWILSGKLNARVYGPDEVLEEAKLFLADSSHSLRVLLEDANEDELKDHPFFKEFRGKDNLEIKEMPADVQDTYDFHFLVMDDDSYRFEDDKTKHAAIAAFGDKEGADNLKEIFTNLWEEGQPVVLQ